MPYGYDPGRYVKDYSFIQRAASQLGAIPGAVVDAKRQEEQDEQNRYLFETKKKADAELANDKIAVHDRYEAAVQEFAKRLEATGKYDADEALSVTRQHMPSPLSGEYNQPSRLIDRLTREGEKVESIIRSATTEREVSQFQQAAKPVTANIRDLSVSEADAMTPEQRRELALSPTGTIDNQPTAEQLRARSYDLSPQARAGVQDIITGAEQRERQQANVGALGAATGQQPETKMEFVNAFVQAGGDMDTGRQLASLLPNVKNGDEQASLAQRLAWAKFSHQQKMDMAKNINTVHKKIQDEERQTRMVASKLDTVNSLKARVNDRDGGFFKMANEIGIDIDESMGTEEIKQAIDSQTQRYKSMLKGSNKQLLGLRKEYETILDNPADPVRASREGATAGQEVEENVIKALYEKFGYNYDSPEAEAYVRLVGDTYGYPDDMVMQALLKWRSIGNQSQGASFGVGSRRSVAPSSSYNMSPSAPSTGKKYEFLSIEEG